MWSQVCFTLMRCWPVCGHSTKVTAATMVCKLIWNLLQTIIFKSVMPLFLAGGIPIVRFPTSSTTPKPKRLPIV